MQEVTFEEAVEQILGKDPRYHREAYLFVRDALEYTKKSIARTTREPILHVTGQQLLSGIREFALGLFGPMAMTVFEDGASPNARTSAKSSLTSLKRVSWPRPNRQPRRLHRRVQILGRISPTICAGPAWNPN
jgi:hypothetical protein